MALVTWPSERSFGIAILDWISRDPQASRVFEEVRRLGIQAYVAGGAVRDFCLELRPQDVDVVVPNDDFRLQEFLALDSVCRVNRHGNRRYTAPSGFRVDVIQPACFYKNFESPEETIRYFDISVNAIGVRVLDGSLFDPIGGIADIRRRQVRTTQPRWQEMSDFESVHLVLRLVRYVERYKLTLLDPHVVGEHLPKLDIVEWHELERLHQMSRVEARARILQLLSR